MDAITRRDTTGSGSGDLPGPSSRSGEGGYPAASWGGGHRDHTVTVVSGNRIVFRDFQVSGGALPGTGDTLLNRVFEQPIRMRNIPNGLQVRSVTTTADGLTARFSARGRVAGCRGGIQHRSAERMTLRRRLGQRCSFPVRRPGGGVGGELMSRTCRLSTYDDAALLPARTRLLGPHQVATWDLIPRLPDLAGIVEPLGT